MDPSFVCQYTFLDLLWSVKFNLFPGNMVITESREIINRRTCNAALKTGFPALVGCKRFWYIGVTLFILSILKVQIFFNIPIFCQPG